jgi:hypothetical protein
VSGINLKTDILEVNLGFPMISPNIGVHYPSADYVRISYEFYQVPIESNRVSDLYDNPEEESTREGKMY